MSEDYIKQVWDNFFQKLNEEEKTFLSIMSNEKNKEIERLNNIISELEKYLEKIIIDGGTRGSMTFWYRQVYDYLQELKGDGSNGR